MISQWISECKEKQKRKPNYFHKTKMMAQLESFKIVPESFSKDFETTAVQKINEHSYSDCLDEERNKIWLEYTSETAESSEQTCEAKIIDSTDPEDTPLFQLISECEEIKKRSEITFLEMETLCTTMEAQLDESSKVVPESFSKDFETSAVQKMNERSYSDCLDEERNKIWLEYTSETAESSEKTCEAKIIDSTDPEDTPLFQLISECEEIKKRSEITFLEMEKLCTTMEAQLDESFKVDQELSLESVENDDEYFDVNSFSKTLLKTLLKHRSKPAENFKRKREAEDL